jgi:hypothetical protein
MSVWIINAGSAFARAASQPRASGERVLCIAAECSPCACTIKQKSARYRDFARRSAAQAPITPPGSRRP